MRVRPRPTAENHRPPFGALWCLGDARGVRVDFQHILLILRTFRIPFPDNLRRNRLPVLGVPRLRRRRGKPRAICPPLAWHTTTLWVSSVMASATARRWSCMRLGMCNPRSKPLPGERSCSIFLTRQAAMDRSRGRPAVSSAGLAAVHPGIHPMPTTPTLQWCFRLLQRRTKEPHPPYTKVVVLSVEQHREEPAEITLQEIP